MNTRALLLAIYSLPKKDQERALVIFGIKR